MSLTISEVESIAKLARLSLTSEEKAMYAEQLSAILGYMEILNEVDTTGVEETTQVTGLQDVVREDVPYLVKGEERKSLIAEFSQIEKEMLQVKNIF